MKKIIVLLFAILVSQAIATTYYVDGNLATGSNNGTSWANAWKTLGAVTGISAGDIVQISGGATAGTCTYSFSDTFPCPVGSSGVAITYIIGQDSSHNGTATFNQTSVGFSHGNFISGQHDIVVSGDAGDGAQHFKLSGTFVGLIELTSKDNVRVAYFDLGSFNNIGNVNSSTHVEVDHVNIKVANDPAADRALYFNISGSAYDDSSVHHCTIQLPYNTTNLNYGPDGIQPGGTGFSIYNNTITTYVDNTLTTTQHMDGIQAQGGNYVKAYNNTISNMTNYGMYWEASNAIFNHLYVWNNNVSVTDPVIATNTSGGIVVEQKTAGTMNDIIVANNTITDLQPSSRTLTVISDVSTAYTNSLIANNCLVNGNGIETDAYSPPSTNNSNITAANAATYFVSYTTYGGVSNNMALTSSASSTLKTGGTSMSSYGITTDITGAAYANPPSIGAYQYSGASGGGGSSCKGKISFSGKVILK